MGFTFGNEGSYQAADSLVKEIDRRFPNLSFIEKTFLETMRESNRGNLQGALEQMQIAYRKDPKQVLNSYLTGLYSSLLNRPMDAVSYFSSIDPGSIELDVPSHTWWYFNFARALIRTGQLDEALRILSYIPDDKSPNAIFSTKAYIYILKNQPDSLHTLVNRLKTLGLTGNPYSVTCNAIARKYALKNDRVNQKKWAVMSLDYLASLPKADKDETWAVSYYMAERLPEALNIYEQLHRKDPQWRWLSKIGCLNVKLGNKDIALSTAAALEKMDLPYPQGRIKYGLAQIHAALGEKEKALDLLKQAFKEGFAFGFYEYDYDFEFLPLFDYPPFQEFVKPKG